MNAKGSVSSLVQTWQVGPGRNGSHHASQDELELTQTVILTPFCLRRTGSGLTGIIDLALGTHVFDEDGQRVRHGQVSLLKSFEITIHQSGAHFATSHPEVSVNGRYLSFTRLRSGDRIRYKNLSWTLESTHDPEGTFVAIRVLEPKSERAELDEKTSQFAAAKRSAWPLWAGLALIVATLVGGLEYFHLWSKRTEAELVPAGAATVLAPIVAEPAPSVETTPPPLDRERLEEILGLIGAGKKAQACDALKATLAEENGGDPIWRKKAALLFQRRCG